MGKDANIVISEGDILDMYKHCYPCIYPES